MLSVLSVTSQCARKVSYCFSRILPVRQDYWVVAGPLDNVPYIPICAGCLAATELGRRESKGTVVPYCSSCLLSIGRTGAGILAFRLAEILSSTAACVFLAMLPWVSETSAVGVALAFAVLPWMIGQIWKNHFESLPSRRGKAVFTIAGGLACRNGEWARQLGSRIGADVYTRRLRIGTMMGWASSGVLIALLATPCLYLTFHPYVRILNLTDEVLVAFVDDHKLGNVQLTSSESPSAGILARIPVGRRRLSARRVDGALVDQLEADVIAGRAHLFTPGRPRSICFWVERTALGRAQDGITKREVLAPATSFWSIESDIDVWFEPALGSNSPHFTGSVVTALRQGACPSTGNER